MGHIVLTSSAWKGFYEFGIHYWTLVISLTANTFHYLHILVRSNHQSSLRHQLTIIFSRISWKKDHLEFLRIRDEAPSDLWNTCYNIYVVPNKYSSKIAVLKFLLTRPPLSHFRCTSSPVASSSSSGGGLVVGYYLCDDPVPYRSQWPSNFITLGQFKHLVPKKGLFRRVFSFTISNISFN